jgi:hypothetical protein
MVGYFAGALPFDSSIDVLEWLFAWPALGIELLSSSLLIGSVGALADVSVAVLDEEVVSVELLDVELFGVVELVLSVAPVPVGLFGVAGSGGAADSLVDGVTGGVAVVVVDDA